MNRLSITPSEIEYSSASEVPDTIPISIKDLTPALITGMDHILSGNIKVQAFDINGVLLGSVTKPYTIQKKVKP